MHLSLPNKKGTQKKRPEQFERGQAIILIVFSIIGLVSMTALAVDGGRAYLEKRNIQNVADSVALGGALVRIKGRQSEWVAATYNIAKMSGYDNNGKTNAVNIYSPPVTGQYAGDIEYIQVVITSRVSTYFGNVIGIKMITVTSESISRSKDSELTQILNGNAIISLAPVSDCQDKHSFWVRGESTLSLYGGGIFINSYNRDCALTQTGNGSIRIEGGEIRVVGGLDVQKMRLLTPAPITGSTPISYPPPFMLPQVGCHKPAEILPDGVTMSAGTWQEKESFPPIGISYLEPGVYCVINTDFIAKGNQQLGGKNVIIKVEGGKIQIGAEADVDLTAPDHGNLAGLLFYMPIDNKNLVVLNGSARSRFRGTILAPGSEIRINGSKSNFGFHSQIIGNTIRSDGTSNIIIVYKDEDNLDAYTMPQVQLIK